MIKVHIFYPPGPSGRFDMAYYTERHMPMVQGHIGAACTGFTVDAGMAGGGPGLPPPYLAVGAFTITSVEAWGAAIAKHGAAIMATCPTTPIHSRCCRSAKSRWADPVHARQPHRPQR